MSLNYFVESLNVAHRKFNDFLNKDQQRFGTFKIRSKNSHNNRRVLKQNTLFSKDVPVDYFLFLKKFTCASENA